MAAEGALSVVIRDLELARKLMGDPVSKDKAKGVMMVTIPEAGKGGSPVTVPWPIDAEAWNQVGKAAPKGAPDGGLESA